MERISAKKGFSAVVLFLAVCMLSFMLRPMTVRADVPVMTTGDFAVSSVSSSSITVRTVSHTAYEIEARVTDQSGNVLAAATGSKYSTSIYVNMKVGSNRAYYVSVRLIDGAAYGEWSAPRGLASVTVSVKLAGGGVKFTMPKLKGIKAVKLYMSTSRTGKYSKIGTLKSKKSKVVKKFKGSGFKKYKNYYYRLLPVLAGGLESDIYYENGFYIYTRIR